MKMRDFAVIMAAALVAMQLPGCMMGGSTEIGNSRSTITGTIAGGAKNSEDVSVQLVADDYIPGTVATDKVFMASVDCDGAYSLSDVPQGRYYLNARGSGKRLLRGPIEINTKETDLAVDSLKATSRLNLTLPSGDTVTTMFIQGTIEAVMVESDTVLLDSVPAGSINIVACKVDQSNSLGRTIVDSMRIVITTGAYDTTVASFGNAAPRILTGVSELEQGVSASYPSYKVTIRALDPEGGEVRYHMSSGPAWLFIDSVTGVVTCAADTLPRGTHAVVVKVTDSGGASSVIRWTVTAAQKEIVLSMGGGEDTGVALMPYLFRVDTSAAVNAWRFSWGEGDTTDWLTSPVAVHMWTSGGCYDVRYQMQYAADGGLSDWSVPHIMVIDGAVDVEPPIITLMGFDTLFVPDSIISHVLYLQFREPGYSAYDNRDGDVTSNVVVSMDTVESSAMTLVIRYDVTDAMENKAFTVRRYIFGGMDAESLPFTITLALADSVQELRQGVDTWVEPGYAAYDRYSGDVSASVVVDTSDLMENINVPGTYFVTYTLALGTTLAIQRIRTVRVTGGSDPYDTLAPVITLRGQDTMLVRRSDVGTYSDPGASAYDDADGDISGSIIVTGSVNMAIAGIYTMTYSVSDMDGNTTVKIRYVRVVDQLNALYIDTADIDTADIDTADIDTADIDTADIDTADIDTTDIDTADIDTADIDTADIDTADIDTADIDTTDIDTTDIDTTDIDTTDIDTTDIDTTDIDTTADAAGEIMIPSGGNRVILCDCFGSVRDVPVFEHRVAAVNEWADINVAVYERSGCGYGPAPTLLRSTMWS